MTIFLGVYLSGINRPVIVIHMVATRFLAAILMLLFSLSLSMSSELGKTLNQIEKKYGSGYTYHSDGNYDCYDYGIKNGLGHVFMLLDDEVQRECFVSQEMPGEKLKAIEKNSISKLSKRSIIVRLKYDTYLFDRDKWVVYTFVYSGGYYILNYETPEIYKETLKLVNAAYEREVYQYGLQDMPTE